MTNYQQLLTAQKEALEKDDKEIAAKIQAMELELEKVKGDRSEILRQLRYVTKKLEKTGK